MNIEMRLKYLLYICQKERDRGFTIIDVVVAIAILGLLTLATLPHQISQAQNNKEAEGRLYVSSINKAQQAFYAEFGKFVTENSHQAWGSLGVGIRKQTFHYKYSISPIGKIGVNAFANATQIDKKLRNYTGVVGIITPVPSDDQTTQGIVCQTKYAGDIPISGAVALSEVVCPGNANPIIHD